MPGPSILRSASVIALLAGFGLAGCETTDTAGAPQPASVARAQDGGGEAARQPVAEAELPDAPLGDDPLSRTVYWGVIYERDPSNIEAAVNYGQALRDLGSTEEAVNFFSRASADHPNNPDLQVEYARTLIAANRAGDAIAPLTRAAIARADDWRVYSLMGVAHDRASQPGDATSAYERALALSPNNPSVLANYGLSRALDGDLEGAEVLLREAAAQPGATAQVRQNLALVIGLQGRFDEAEEILRADLPPDAVANNVAYYRSMLTQPAAWSDLGEGATQ